jgi:signal transduction histidine kinase
MTPHGNRTVLYSLLFAAVAVVSFNTWLAFRSISMLLDSEFQVQHTLEVEAQVERIMGSAKDAETGSRGFLITGDENYLEPYKSAVVELPEELDQFGVMARESPVQQAMLGEMRAVLEQRLALLREGIDDRRRGAANEELHALVLTGTGKAAMDRLRQVADEMEAREQRLLAIRTARAKASSTRARLTVALASVLDFLLVVMMFRYLSRERDRRAELEQAAERLAVARAEAEANAADARTRADEVRLLNATLEERVDQRTAELEATNRELEAFSYSVSHDLRSPLRTIDGFSLALEEDYAEAVDAVGRDYILRVRTGVQRMGQLIDVLLQLSRITRAELTREEFDLSELAESVAEDLRAQEAMGQEAAGGQETARSPGHGLNDGPTGGGPTGRGPTGRLTLTIAPRLRTCADPKLIRVALENLLGNAVKFSSKLEHAVVEFGWDEGEHAWFVRDNGAGFDMQYASKLFNAFHRLHGDKDFKGSGIGLATVARVVRRHHGRIWAKSEIGHGATFWFTLG